MKKSKKNRNTIAFKIISWLLLLTTLITSIFLIYFEILPIIYLVLFILIIGIIVFLLFRSLNSNRLRKWIKIVLSIPSVIMIIIFTLLCFYSYGTIDFFNNILDVGLRHDTYSVYVLNNSNYEKIKDLDNKIIGVSEVNDETTKKAIDKVSKKIEFNMAEYDSVGESIDSLKDSEVDAIIALDSAIDILKEDSNDYNDLKAIYTFSIKTKVKTLNSKKDVPFHTGAEVMGLLIA